MADNIPDWLAQMDAQQPTNSPQGTGVIPDWLKEMDAQQPETVTSTAEAPNTTARDVLANAATGVARVPGAILGLPHLLGHTLNWGQAQFDNALNYFLNAKAPHETGADLDARDPVMKVLPSAQDVDKRVFQGISAVAGRDVQPYEPESFFGKLGQAAITGGLGGFLDPLAAAGAVGRGATVGKALVEGGARRAAQTAVAADAADAVHQAFPDSPGLAAVAALAAHAGTSAAARGAAKGFEAVAPLVSPTNGARTAAGKVLQQVDNTQPGLAAPDKPALTAATDASRQAVADIGDGMDDYTAGGALRDGLQARKDQLRAGRDAVADRAYEAFRAEPPMTVDRLTGFVARPSFRRAMHAAAADVLDEGGKPLTKYWSVDTSTGTGGTEGVPGIRITAPALPPDVLDRIKGKLDDAVGAAPAGSRAQRTAKILRDDFVKALDTYYPSSYPQTRADFAAASRPLDPLETGPNARVLDSTMSFGKRTYTMPQDRVADTFLKSSAQRSDFNNLIAGFGGDKDAALGALEENLASKVAGAVNGDGTLSLDAFNRSVRPYAKTLSMWFPKLSQKFASAEAAQKSLDTMRAQDTLAQSIREHGLRNDSGFVTGDSVDAWLARNEKVLDKTQAPAAVGRLRQIVKALPRAPIAASEAVLEGAPAAVGFGLGGAESGIFGAMFHAIPKALAGPQLDKFAKAYSEAIERAFVDPNYATLLAKRIGARSHNITPMQALGDAVAEDLKRGVLATPVATTAAGANAR